MTDPELTLIISEAAERVREQLEHEQPLIRADVAELLEDYDALADVHLRVVRNLNKESGNA